MNQIVFIRLMFIMLFLPFGAFWSGAFAQFTGGNSDGHSLVSKTDVAVCTLPSYANIFLGGNSDGHSLVSKIDVAVCTLPSYANIFLGGNSDGHSLVSKTDVAVCTLPSYANIFLGGNSDGHSVVSKTNVAICILPTYTNIFMGGDADGHGLVSKTDVAVCVLPTYVNIFTGGNSDGHALLSSSCLSVIRCQIQGVVSNDTTICSGTIVTLVASGGTDYLWSTGEITTFININPSVDTNYLVIVSEGICSDSALVNIMVNAVPVITTSDVSVALGESVDITADATGNSTYEWSPPTGLSCTTCQTSIATPSETSTYYVMATDSNFCISTDSVIVTVEALTKAFVPNGFSPNNDGENDLFRVLGSNIKELQLIVYDRWGEKVFESTSQQNGWDGTYKGQAMNSAVFVYFLTAVLSDGTSITQSGNVSLVR